MPKWVHQAEKKYRKKGLSKEEAGQRAYGGYAKQQKRLKKRGDKKKSR